MTTQNFPPTTKRQHRSLIPGPDKHAVARKRALLKRIGHGVGIKAACPALCKCSACNIAATRKAVQASMHQWVQSAKQKYYTWGTCSSTTNNGYTLTWDTFDDLYDVEIVKSNNDIRVAKGLARTIHLPDGSRIQVAADGNYTIEDQNAKVTYAANRLREFNPYINASDLLASFVRYVGSLGLSQADIPGLPVQLFVNWLIIEAAKADQEPVPADVTVDAHPLLQARLKPKCLHCGRFLPKRTTLPVCSTDHAAALLQRSAA